MLLLMRFTTELFPSQFNVTLSNDFCTEKIVSIEIAIVCPSLLIIVLSMISNSPGMFISIVPEFSLLLHDKEGTGIPNAVHVSTALSD